MNLASRMRAQADSAATETEEFKTLWDELVATIDALSKRNLYRLVNPITTLPSRPFIIRKELEESLIAKLRQEGFKYTEYPDPDPGHPCSAPYSEVTWK